MAICPERLAGEKKLSKTQIHSFNTNWVPNCLSPRQEGHFVVTIPYVYIYIYAGTFGT